MVDAFQDAISEAKKRGHDMSGHVFKSAVDRNTFCQTCGLGVGGYNFVNEITNPNAMRQNCNV